MLLCTCVLLRFLLLLHADSDDLILASTNFTVDSTGSEEIVVQLGMLSVEASFDQLAWAGMYYPRPRQSTSTIIIHAIIVGAQVRARQATPACCRAGRCARRLAAPLFSL